MASMSQRLSTSTIEKLARYGNISYTPIALVWHGSELLVLPQMAESQIGLA
jgi:hypothetical protein